jgi:hypothetical protein
MEVNSATATSVSALVNSPQPQPPAPKTDQQAQQDSTVVKLSEQAQQLNRAESQNNNTERAEPKPQEAAEPPGIQFLPSDTKGGRIDAFA